MEPLDETNEKAVKEDQATEVMDFTKPDYIFELKQYHEWRQQGPYLICKSCEIDHASFIGMGKQLIGLNEDGTPILKELES